MEKECTWGDQTLADLISGEQVMSNHKEYYLDDMEGIIDIGSRRENQEDALLMLSNKDVRFMAVADGMGGLPGSEYASQFALITLGTWFQKRKISSTVSEKKMLEELKTILFEINNNVYRKGYGTTLVLALKLKDNTITFNIGDSRIYAFNNNNIKQITEDHSLAWSDYEKGRIKNKDDIRFCKYNNIINNYLGGALYFDDLIVDNDDYSDLLLCSDGVSDIVSDEELLRIFKNEYDNVTNRIINRALTKHEIKKGLDSYLFYNTTFPGKDNASAIVYKKGL